MSYQDQKPPRPSSGEAPFAINEVFYSQTDTRGVIRSGNSVFQRVADYEWDDLIGAPHKIIRHQDMPSGVFHLFWETIKQGNPIGAYVKNKARDGLHYWVFAVVLPFEDGYLSARIKPTSAQLQTVEALYEKLRMRERDEDLSPDQSAEILLDHLKELGFENYAQFEALSLAEELTAREVALREQSDPTLDKVKMIFEAAQSMTQATEGLIRDFEGMQTIPQNMRVLASRLEPTGGPISTLSQNYSKMTQEMSEWFEANVRGPNSNFSTVGSSVQTSLFLTGMVRILNECLIQMDRERRHSQARGSEDSHAQLSRVVTHYLDLSQAGLKRVRQEAARILDACSVMNRQVLGLSSTRVMCKIESARLPEGADSLEDIIHQLKLFQERVAELLDMIEKHARVISLAKDRAWDHTKAEK